MFLHFLTTSQWLNQRQEEYHHNLASSQLTNSLTSVCFIVFNVYFQLTHAPQYSSDLKIHLYALYLFLKLCILNSVTFNEFILDSSIQSSIPSVPLYLVKSLSMCICDATSSFVLIGCCALLLILLSVVFLLEIGPLCLVVLSCSIFCFHGLLLHCCTSHSLTKVLLFIFTVTVPTVLADNISVSVITTTLASCHRTKGGGLLDVTEVLKALICFYLEAGWKRHLCCGSSVSTL